MIIRSSVIRLEIEMVVHISAEMVLTIITMGTGAKNGIIIEVSEVEIPMSLHELFQDLYGHLRLLTLLNFFIHHQCGLLVAILDSMVWCINVMVISFNTEHALMTVFISRTVTSGGVCCSSTSTPRFTEKCSFCASHATSSPVLYRS